MRKDLIVGILASVLLHVTFLFGFNTKAVKKAKTVEEQQELIQIEMPPIEPEKEETVDELPEEQVTNQLAPPSLVDLPTVVPVNAFTQPLQPPPPPGLTAAKGAISIPVTKPGSQFGKGMKDLFDVANLDQQPVPRVQPAPAYPFEMRRAGISGEVTIGFIVTSSGDVVEAYVIKSSQREFEVPALQAVQKWKFRPGKKGGRAVNTKMQVPLVFNLNEDS